MLSPGSALPFTDCNKTLIRNLWQSSKKDNHAVDLLGWVTTPPPLCLHAYLCVCVCLRLCFSVCESSAHRKTGEATIFNVAENEISELKDQSWTCWLKAETQTGLWCDPALTRLICAYRCGPLTPALPTAPPPTCCGRLRHRGAQETTW